MLLRLVHRTQNSQNENNEPLNDLISKTGEMNAVGVGDFNGSNMNCKGGISSKHG